ncbi:lipopolysaccharide biosynthesis protein [Rhodospirillaceae bacterium SYSU D60014]|uniref:lipopolysaccharide biosynthesis protein n=1 Tax=Virgifigura deserti TaxID=2268457 RepID=UPI0013C474F0
MLDKKTIVKSAIWSTAGSWGSQVIGLAVFTILAIFLGPEAYGLIAMAMAVIAVSDVLIVGGIADALIQRKQLAREHIDSVFWLLIGLAACIVALAQICAGPIANAFGEPRIAELIRWLGILPVLHALSAVPTALLTRDMRFDLLALRSVLGLSIGGAVGIGMALNGFGAWSLVGQQLTQQAIIAAVLWSTGRWRPGLRFSLRHLRELLGFGSQMIGLKLVKLGEQQLVRIIIGASLGPTALGFFHMGWRLLDILRSCLLLPLANTAMPAFSKMQSNLPQVRRALHTGARLSTLIGFPSFLGLAAIAPSLIPSVFGEQWAGSIRVTQILALLGALWSLTHFYGAVMRGLGRPMMQLAPQILGFALLSLMLFFFARHGIEAVAWCMLIRALLILPLTAYLARRLTGLQVNKQYRACLPALVSSVAMAAAVIGWRSAMTGRLSGLMMLASGVLVGVAVYCACIVVLDRRVAREVIDLGMVALGRRPIAGVDS